MNRLIFLVVTISISVVLQMCTQAIAKEATFSIGIPLIQTHEETLSRWQPLADYLNSVSEPNHRFEIKVFNLQELETAVSGSNVDFLFVNPSVYVNYSYRFGLTSPLATLVNREQGFNLSEFSGVVFTRSDREDINQLDDLKGLVVAAPSVKSLAAYQMQASELVKRGIDPKSQITLLETGLPLTNTLNAVMSGKADVGFMRAGVLETWQQQGIIQPNSYRIVEPRQFGGFPWVTSTRLYPEWPFSALAHTDPEVVRQVTAALLNLPFNSPTSEALGIAGFTIP
ncbi:MAG: phosphate/phosphite/phosphonate ABC transporter substrate-binding protein, partial [Oceanospirillales bacterium]